MIHSVARPHARSWRSTHLLLRRRSLLIMAVAIGLVVILWSSGYFAGVDWTTLFEAVGRTSYRLAIAYAIAVTLGVTLALLIGWSGITDAVFPFFDVLQNIPSFALIPLFIYFFGFTGQMIIFFAVSSIIWPILFAVLTSIKSAHTDLNDAATIFGAMGWKRMTTYLAPLSLPAILSGSIVGIAIGWEAVIGAEIITSVAGFGYFIKDASVTGISPAMIAGTFTILIIVFTVNRLVWAPLLADSARRYAE
ncbi:MAG: hypothetical protein JWN18_508 [Parcubacteria group bacterium]|nr:hypothetical protein [Parcubacteria group bacterium]